MLLEQFGFRDATYTLGPRIALLTAFVIYRLHKNGVLEALGTHAHVFENQVVLPSLAWAALVNLLFSVLLFFGKWSQGTMFSVPILIFCFFSA